MIEVRNLTKIFGTNTAVNDISFSVSQGEIYGLVGSDGAGKTTTLRLLVGALTPSQGEITLCGFNVLKQVESARAQIGYLSQRFSLYEDLTVLENIRFFAEVRGLKGDEWKPRCMEILEFVGLANFTTRRAGLLSGGMKQKLGLASALVTRPRVLLLDEPTTGVDPVTRQDFWRLIFKIAAQEGISVLLTTPYMDEAVRCTRLGFMRSGRIIAEGTPTQIKAPLQGRILEILTSAPLQVLIQVRVLPHVEDARAFGDKIHLRIKAGKSEQVLRSLQQAAETSPASIQNPRVIPPTLEDVFISLTSNPSAEEKPHA